MSAYQWKNWGGNIQCRPQKIKYPSTEAELLKIVQRCRRQNLHIRVVGSGHSWTPLCESDDVLISLDHYQGIIEVDPAKKQATVKAGTKIKQLGELLFIHNLGMENMGDVDEQSIAGAISTGTHGTGIRLGSIPTQVVALRLITASGDIVDCSNEQHPEIFKAAQISLGTLGIISQITLQCVSSYKLKCVSTKESVEEYLNNWQAYNKDNRNVEFFWFPHTNMVQTKKSNLTEEPAQEYTWTNYMNDIVVENGVFKAMCEVSRWIPKTAPKISELAISALSESERIDWSHRVYVTPRLVKFMEMEYNVSVEQFEEVFAEIRDCLETKQFPVNFPTENRFLKGDDILLSPAYGRDSVHISLHVYKGKPYKAYFDAMESIFRNHNARPHWGKMHNLTADELSDLYPKWESFCRIRQELDPSGLFLNGYVRQLFGVYQ